MRRPSPGPARTPVYFTDRGVEALPWWEELLRTVAIQCSLLSLLVLVSIACLVCALALRLDNVILVPLLMLGLVILPLALTWSLCYSVAPELTKYGTLLAIIALVLVGPLPIILLQSREQARRSQCASNLRQLGYELHQISASRPQDPFASSTATNLSELLPNFREPDPQDPHPRP